MRNNTRRITHLQANALFELSTRFGVNLFALYPKLKKKKGSVILILEYDMPKPVQIGEQKRLKLVSGEK